VAGATLFNVRVSRRVNLVVLGILVLAACGSGGQAAVQEPPPTVGGLPDLGVAAPTAATAAASSTPDTDPQPSTVETTGGTDRPGATTTTATSVAGTTPAVVDSRIGALAGGNRLLMIGDSIMGATSVDNGGAMCADLVPRGWQVGMDTEEGRHADAGVEVTKRRLVEPWDAAVVGLGSNYKDDPEVFASEIRQILDALAPRPVLLVTVSENEDELAEVNYVLRDTALRYANVRVLEWSERTRIDESLTGADGLHLNDRGIAVFVAMVGVALGDAPDDGEGACLTLPVDEQSPDDASASDGDGDDSSDGGSSGGGSSDGDGDGSSDSGGNGGGDGSSDGDGDGGGSDGDGDSTDGTTD